MPRHYDILERQAVERLDVLDEVPRAICAVKGCNGTRPHEWAGNWGTRYLCARHLPAYRTHSRIVARIRTIRSRRLQSAISTRTGAP
jgi:hypothetical protein